MTHDEFRDLWFQKLGVCGCGNPLPVLALLRELLEVGDLRRRDRWDESTQRLDAALPGYESALHWLPLYWLDHAELSEHGGGVRGYWLTELGEQTLEYLRENEMPEALKCP